MNKSFLKWWLLFCIQLLIAGIAVYYNYLNYVLEHDATYLSLVIIGLWAFTSFYLGWKVVKGKRDLETQWFSAESCMTIGMIGTVIGFLMMLGDSFAHIDVGNTDAMRDTISKMAVGLSTALITTLNGLIASLFLKGQMVLIERDHEE